MVTKKSCAEKMFDESNTDAIRTCDSCNRELRSSAEWLCSDHRVICNGCYRSLLDPNRKIKFEH